MTVKFRYLKQEELVQVGGLDMELTMRNVEEAFRLFGSGECILPSKAVLRWGDTKSERTTRGHLNAMPGYVGGKYDMAGQKWVGGFYRNPAEFGLPSITGLIILNDPNKGLPVAVMDGTLISAMRTGAQAGIAAKYLAREDSRTVGIIGAGVQSRTALMAFSAALPGLSDAIVYDIQVERSQAFCEQMAEYVSLSYHIGTSSRDVASQADILNTATSTVIPVIDEGWIPKGCLYCQMGAHEAKPQAILEFDKIVVDNWYEIQHRAVQSLAIAKADGLISDMHIHAELAEIILHRKNGRENDDERIFFSAVGMGLLDIAVATSLLKRAEQQNVGTMLSLWETSVFM